jgi:hypothetical protein
VNFQVLRAPRERVAFQNPKQASLAAFVRGEALSLHNQHQQRTTISNANPMPQSIREATLR